MCSRHGAQVDGGIDSFVPIQLYKQIGGRLESRDVSKEDETGPQAKAFECVVHGGALAVHQQPKIIGDYKDFGSIFEVANFAPLFEDLFSTARLDLRSNIGRIVFKVQGFRSELF